MTSFPPYEFSLSIHPEPGSLTVRLAGDLDYDTSDDLVDAVTEHMAAHARLYDVRLDFRELTWIDSAGLSALLMIRRRTGAAGVTLHLDNRPTVLNRLLDMTNVLDHLTAPATREADGPHGANEGDVGSENDGAADTEGDGSLGGAEEGGSAGAGDGTSGGDAGVTAGGGATDAGTAGAS
ncbi:STAS domain-containing protein [Streptomyces longispororuber]|uniref:STAS domain-containing protein n=1 Tax=Streptomyces longispororuber TaxID=68230 RepID=UPI0036FEBE11